MTMIPSNIAKARMALYINDHLLYFFTTNYDFIFAPINNNLSGNSKFYIYH